MTADFIDIEVGNARYADRFADTGLAGRPGRPARRLAVVTCMDARIDPLAALGLAAGDANVLRIPGGRVTDEVVRALAMTRWLLGVERVAVIVHTECKAAGTSAPEVVAAIRAAGGPDLSGTPFQVAGDQEAALRGDVDRVRTDPALGGVAAAGYRYDVGTGRLSRVC